ncbi:MAG: zinc metallopeptidase [Oscillospiraceae bacterium]|nr:zinc metallopeptidase [Oscillospiraceae bacterium]
MFYWDSTYFLVLIGAVISLIASSNVTRTFNKFKTVPNARRLTAEAVAANILRLSGITDVRIEPIKGNLTDHYSPTEKVLRLSDSVYGQTSVAALGVAAHECGHAIQHHVGYAPLKLRSLSVPAANFGAKLSWPLILIGILMGNTGLAQAGVLLFSFVVAFQLITLPVEFNASRRAMSILRDANILYGEELTGAQKVLSAAALTYVAAVASSLLQLLRLVLLTRRSRR